MTDEPNVDGMVVIMGGKPVRIVRNRNPEIEVSEDVLRMRDGMRNPSQGDTVQIVVDSRGRHSSVPSSDERGTYKLADHEVVAEEVMTPHRGERRRRYTLRRKEG